MKATLLAVALAGTVAGLVSFPRTISIDDSADWRAVSKGLRRSGEAGALAATDDALVHFHDVRGGIEAVELSLASAAADDTSSAPSGASPGAAANAAAPRSAGGATVEIRRNGKPLVEGLQLHAEPQRVFVPGASAGGREIDVALWTTGGRGRVRVHGIDLQRGEAGGVWRVVPLLCGLAVAGLLRRERPAWAAAFGVLAAGIAAGALAAVLDPVALLVLKPGTRTMGQAAALAVLTAGAITRAHVRFVPPLAVLGAAVVLYAPTLRYGLVYDDFLWTRPWTWHEVASTFVGSEDPTGVSNSYYRPWASTSHALEFALWGFRPDVFHATNVGLIMLAGVLAWAMFRRLPVSDAAALAGALVWIAHPMSASAVAWMSQRTDTLLACLYLATLWALLARPFDTRRLAATVVFGALTFGAKELAVTLPAAALLLVWCARRRPAHTAAPDAPGDDARRVMAVVFLFVIAAEYVAFWASLFPEKLAGRAAMSAGWGAFDPGHLGHWLRLVPALYGPLLLPTGYQHWWTTFLHDWSPAYLGAVMAVWVALAAAVLTVADATRRRLGLLALAWPLLAIVPLLGLRGIDLYRGGLLIALGAGWLAMLVAQRLHHRHPLLPALFAAALVFAAAPRTTAAAAAWGPGGFYRSMTQRHIQMMPSWLASLQPHARAHFKAQVEHDAHMGYGR